MPKSSGLGDRLWVGGYDLSGDIGAVEKIACPRSTLDVTGIDKSAHERIYGTKDGEITFTAFFNPDTVAGGASRNAAHSVLSVLPTTDIQVMYGRGTTIGNPSAAMLAKQLNYDPKRAADGSFTFKVDAKANGYGLEWGKLATAGARTDTTGTNGTGLDLGTGSVSFGLQAYLQVLALTGTNVIVKLQHSTDNGGTDPFADITGGAFTSATTAPQTQRLATASNATIKRYVRVVTTGTFTSATFTVMVNRNPVAVTF